MDFDETVIYSPDGGRVFAADGDRLGDYVVTDYVRARKGRRRSA